MTNLRAAVARRIVELVYGKPPSDAFLEHGIITLADVLRALTKAKTAYISIDLFSETELQLAARTVAFWNLAANLDGQSDELVRFLADAMGVEE